MADQIYTYEVKGGRTERGLITAIEENLSLVENMETQVTTDETGCAVLQARVRKGKWKQLIGLDKAITVRFNTKTAGEICMELGEAKWADKGTVMTVSMFVLWPLAITSGIGIYQQKKLPEKIKNVADIYMGASNRISEWKKPLVSDATMRSIEKAVIKIGARL